MTVGKPFEVSKDVYERAMARYKDREDLMEAAGGYYWMTNDDKKNLFSDAILMGYGLYNCMVHEEDGKYICTWECGDSCD